MTSPDTLGTDTVQRLGDDLAIRNLVARLAQLADTKGPDDLDDYVDLFTEDATWAMTGNERHGRADIREGARERRLSGQQGPGTNSRHVITTQAIRFDGSDTAVSDAYFMFVGDTTKTPIIRIMGHYHDLVRRDRGTWKIASRQITSG